MNELELKLKESIAQAVKEAFDYEASNDVVMIETPKDPTNGDYSSNIAMRLTKILRNNPLNIARGIVDALNGKLSDVDRIEIAGPGFINFWMKKTALADIINKAINLQDDFGACQSGKGTKVLVEYVSANPTGALHCGHARGACWGDSVCRLYKKAGYEVLREYYINDAGHQIDMLGESIYQRYLESYGLDFQLPEDGYHGQDVKEITLEIKEEVGDKYLHTSKEEAVEYFKLAGREKELARIKVDLEYYRCGFDSWVSEKWIVSQGRVEKALQVMIDKGLTYQKDGAFWFKSSEYGDDKDRVLRKSDGYYTYLTPDIANHIYKFERGYDKVVDLWGADHHGYIPRMKAAMQALGHGNDALEFDIIQMVRLVENGEEVKMSKRTGNAITLRELIDDIGCDAARYFFLSKAVDTHMDLDLGLAKSQSNDNPVYYAQYAYARICKLLKQAPEVKVLEQYDLLTDERETEILKLINSFTNTVSDAAATRAPNKLCNFIQKLAAAVHTYYGSNCKVNDPSNPELTAQRVALLEAAKVTMHNALELIGVSSPETM